ncbi:hypothetical protein RRF57_010255 [Xylaria bambusicola]|uniref:Uncharacterized protein n=1 Tax=Xylaria bambusicola TaxID=326684 RepID=A0AAN7US59_9PEZI
MEGNAVLIRVEQRDSKGSTDDDEASSTYPRLDDPSENPLQLRGSYLRRVVPDEEVRLESHRSGAFDLGSCCVEIMVSGSVVWSQTLKVNSVAGTRH